MLQRNDALRWSVWLTIGGGSVITLLVLIGGLDALGPLGALIGVALIVSGWRIREDPDKASGWGYLAIGASVIASLGLLGADLLPLVAAVAGLIGGILAVVAGRLTAREPSTAG